MPRTCYLHIGTGKTGSTSIQATFSGNRERLAAAGLLYPGGASCHYRLVSLFSARPRRVRDHLKSGMTDDAIMADVHAFRDGMLAEIAESDAPAVLLSSEDFFTLRPPAFARAMEFVRGIAPEVVVVCYIRHPVGRMLSGLQQRVKVGRMTLAEFDPATFERSMTERLEEILPALEGAELRLRPFDRQQLRGGDVVRDLLQVCGMPDDVCDGLETVRKNESLSHEAMQIADVLARTHPSRNERQWNKARARKVHQRLQEIGGMRFALPPDLAARVEAVGAAEVARLRDRFGLTFSDVTAPEGGAAWGPQTVEDLAQVINSLQLENERLRARLARPK